MSHVKRLFTLILLVTSITGLRAAIPAATPTQPVTPLTITVKQTGEACWKTLYKVPVEISIANNTDKCLQIKKPYFSNIKFWNTTNIKIMPLIGALSEISTAALIGMLTIIPFSLFVVSTKAVEPLLRCQFEAMQPNGTLTFTGISIPAGLKICKDITAILYCMGLPFRLINLSKLGVSYSLKPNATLPIKGYLSAIDMQKIHNGAIPRVIEEVTA